MLSKFVSSIACALATFVGANAQAEPRQPLKADEARDIAREAYIFGKPYVDNYRVYLKAPVDPGHPLPVPFNEFLHLTKLAGPEIGDTPNNDALFSYTILDLRREPVVVSVPKVPEDRLYMLQMGDVSTDTLPYISSIATGTNAGNYVVVGPDYSGYLPADAFNGVIATRGQFVAVTGRTAIDGPEDLAAVMTIQNGYKVMSLGAFLGVEAQTVPSSDEIFLPWDSAKADGSGFFDYMNMAVGWQLPRLDQAEMFERFGRIGVIPGRRFDVSDFPEEIQAAINEGIALAKEDILQQSGRLQTDVGGGWQFGTEDIARVGDDHLMRAAVSTNTIYPNTPDHAVYGIARTDADGKTLSGGNSYRLNMPADLLPPANGFWSMTMYDSRTTAMVPNVLERYSIGDRTEGLVFDESGALNICIEQVRPNDSNCNWLPAPEGEFYLIMRLYAPDTAKLEAGWVPPAIEKTR